MRIAVVGSWAQSLLNFRGPFIETLLRRGHHVWTAASGEASEVRSRLAAMGVDYEALPLRRSSVDPLGDARTLIALRRIFAERSPELLLTYTVKPTVFGHLAARWAGVPRRYALITGLGWTFGSSTREQRIVGALAQGLYRAALREADGVIFQNADDEEVFVKRRILGDGMPTHVVAGSGVDLERFSASPVPEGDPSFLLIARLLRAKGVVEYCEAARIVRRTAPEATFGLVGPEDPAPGGISARDLRPWTEDGSVEYHGGQDDVRPFLKRSTVYVLPSYREGLPRTILEAMATGRAVVTTDVPGCRETVREGENGRLVPPRDPEALARVLLELLEERAVLARMGEVSRAIAEERFDVRLVNRDLVDALDL
jgi:glycosyltransferase involved in cell wall biosynthesis